MIKIKPFHFYFFIKILVIKMYKKKIKNKNPINRLKNGSLSSNT